MTQTLEQEKFDTVRELSQLGVAIAEGRAVLEKLKSETTTYVTEREEKAIQKVKEILEESRDALAEVDKNHETLTSYLTDARAYVRSITGLYDTFAQLVLTFEKSTDALEDQLDRKRAEIAKVQLEIRRQFSHLAGERAALKSDKIKREEEWRKIHDRAATLERGIKRLKENRI